MEEMLYLFAQFKNPFGREEITFRNKWFNLLIREPRPRKLLKKLEREIQKFLIDIPFEEMKILVKMNLAGVKNALAKTAEVDKIYRSCFENHFGFLPLVVTNFFQICPLDGRAVQEENIALFQKAKAVMESKNYIFSTDVDGFFAGMYAWFSNAGLMVFKVLRDRSMQHPITQEILYIREKINTLKLENVHNGLAEARFMCLLGGKNVEALELLDRYQNELTKLIGPESNRFAYIFELKIILYVQLGNRKMANQALKKYSKYVPEERKLYKQFINDHIEEYEKLQKKKPDFKNFEACCYFRLGVPYIMGSM
jgi:tetratricopeptide (TPR) repeat protein